MINQHTHQGPFDSPSQPGFPTPPGAVPPPPGYGYGGNDGYLQPPPPPPQSYQGYGGGGGGYNEGGQRDYYSFNPPHRYPQPQHIGHEQRYGYQGDDAVSSFLRACLGTLCCCFICQECCFI